MRRNGYFVEYLDTVNQCRVTFKIMGYDLSKENAIKSVNEKISNNTKYKNLKLSQVVPTRGYHICRYCG